MNNRSIRTATVVTIAAALAITACGDSEAGLEAGNIELDDERRAGSDDEDGAAAAGGAGVAVVLASGAPDYCHTLVDMSGPTDQITSDQAIVLYADLLDGLVADGPESLRSVISDHAKEARAVRDLDIDLLSADPGGLNAEELAAVFAFASGSERFDALADELLPEFRDDCGDDLVDSLNADNGFLPGAANQANQTGSGSTGTLDAQTQEVLEQMQADAPEFVPFSEAVDGPFGTGEVSNATIEITDAVWSNRGPGQFLQPDLEPSPEDSDRRILYLTVDVINNDSNDALDISVEHFALVDGSGKATAAVKASTGAGIGRDLTPLTAQTKTFGFELGEVVDAAALTLRFADAAIPEFIDVIPSNDAAPSPYPLGITPPAPGEYIGSNSVACAVPWTWTVDDATVLLDIPAELDGVGRVLNARASVGQRWLRLTGSVTTGNAVDSPDYLCSGNINKDDFRLVVDGLGSVPMGAPNSALGTNESLVVDLFWSIPSDAEEVAIRGVGSDGNSFDSPFTLPELPAVRGE